MNVSDQMNVQQKTVALYTEVFLTPSMTFIYRQLTSLPDEWEAFVMARRRANDSLFPYGQVYCRGRSFRERVLNRLYREMGVRYASLGRRSSEYFGSVLAGENPGLIHAHFGPSALEILPIAKQLAIPMVTTFHGFDASLLLRDRTYIKQLRDLFAYSFVITVSETMRRDLIALGASERRTQCVYIGAPVEKFKQTARIPIVAKVRTRMPITFLQVSNFVEKKGHRYTLTAFAELLAYYPPARLVLAGDGPLRRQMEQLAAGLGLGHAVEFIGHKDTSQVIELMSEGDCFVHHSVTAANGDKEGIPTVLMEAMASGMPVIATIHAGIPELIHTNETGYLVAERDVDAYVATLRAVLEDDGSIGRAARKVVEEGFSMDKQVQVLTDKYNQIIGNPS